MSSKRLSCSALAMARPSRRKRSMMGPPAHKQHGISCALQRVGQLESIASRGLMVPLSPVSILNLADLLVKSLRLYTAMAEHGQLLPRIVGDQLVNNSILLTYCLMLSKKYVAPASWHGGFMANRR